MALTATIYTFEIQLSDVDRGVYESLSLRVAQHPSESDAYLVARVLAYCREYAEGIVFSRGVSDPEEPTISVRDLTGSIRVWVEIGTPDAARLHRAGKRSPRVAVYTHREPGLLLRPLEGERIHQSERLELYAFDRALVAALVERLARRMTFDLSISDSTIYVALGGETLAGAVTRLELPDPRAPRQASP